MSTKLKISEVKPNPDNPRVIKDVAFKKLVKSLKEFPEMAEVREVVVNKDHIILGGNMRFRAMQEAGWKEVPVKVVDWPEDKQREFIVKDNVSGGDWDWDDLANTWDLLELESWGLDLPVHADDFNTDFDLPDGDKDTPGQMTFTLAPEQIEAVKNALEQARGINGKTYGNENTNGNALFWLAESWLTQNK